jgi:thiamine biosynthesis lipoprotein
MGTVFSFDVRAEPTDEAVLEVQRAVLWLHEMDRIFSTYRPDSQISRLGRGELTVGDCVPEVTEILGLCAEAERLSDGWFNHRIGGRLDPSAMVKGWAVDRVSSRLKAAGLPDHSVNGGGDVQVSGERAPGEPWRIGIADPFTPGQIIAVVSGRDLAVATSGTAERGSHILDPHTARPSTGLVSITLVGPRLTQVDACATAAFAMGDQARAWVSSLTGIEAFAVTAEATSWRTPGFPALAA